MPVPFADLSGIARTFCAQRLTYIKSSDKKHTAVYERLFNLNGGVREGRNNIDNGEVGQGANPCLEQANIHKIEDACRIGDFPAY